SQPHPRSTARARSWLADSQTNVCSRWPRCPPTPTLSVSRRKPALPPYAAAGARPTRPFPCPTLLSLESSDESHTLYTSYTASFVSSSSVLSTSSLLETVGGPCRHPIKGVAEEPAPPKHPSQKALPRIYADRRGSKTSQKTPRIDPRRSALIRGKNFPALWSCPGSERNSPLRSSNVTRAGNNCCGYLAVPN